MGLRLFLEREQGSNDEYNRWNEWLPHQAAWPPPNHHGRPAEEQASNKMRRFF